MSSPFSVDRSLLEYKLIAGFGVELWHRKYALPTGVVAMPAREVAPSREWEGWGAIALKLGYPDKVNDVREAVLLLCGPHPVSNRETLDSLLSALTSTPPVDQEPQSADDEENLADDEELEMGAAVTEEDERSGDQSVLFSDALLDEEVEKAEEEESQPLEPVCTENQAANLTGVFREERRSNRKVRTWEVTVAGGQHKNWFTEAEIRNEHTPLVEELTKHKGADIPVLGSQSQVLEGTSKGNHPGCVNENTENTVPAPWKDVDESPPIMLTNSSGGDPSNPRGSFQLGQATLLSSSFDTGAELPEEPFFESIPSLGDSQLPLATGQDPEDVSIRPENLMAGDPMEVDHQESPQTSQGEDDVPQAPLTEGAFVHADAELDAAANLAQVDRFREWDWSEVVNVATASQAPTEIPPPNGEIGTRFILDGEKIIVITQNNARVDIPESNFEELRCMLSCALGDKARRVSSGVEHRK